MLGFGSRGVHPGPMHTAAPAEVKGGGNTGDVGGAVDVDGVDADEIEMEDEVGRLVEWRDELLATGMYTSQNPIVTELNRRISSATGRRDTRPLQREE